jgi:hypothetical protein
MRQLIFYVFLYGIYTYIITQLIRIISIDHSWYVQFNFSNTWISWNSLMAYYKAHLNSSGDKAYPCYRPFWRGKLSDIYLPIQTLLYVSFRHTLVGLNNFMDTPNSIRILYNTSLLSYILSWNLRTPDVLSHCTPIFSPITDECKRSDQ